MLPETKLRQYIGKSLFLVSTLVILISGCRHTVVGPLNQGGSGQYICYEKQVSGRWRIFKADASSGATTDISNYNDEEYPQCSPNGRYVVFTRDTIVYSRRIYVRDFQTGTYTELTEDGGQATTLPQWTRNGSVYFAYQRPIGSPTATYLMNPDGTGKRKILGSEAPIYFYSDNYTFLYVNGTQVYKTNIDSSINEFIVDLQPDATHYLTVRDFNSDRGELLVNSNVFPGDLEGIGTYDVNARALTPVVMADSGFLVIYGRFSRDFSAISFVEGDTITNHRWFLSIFRDGSKQRLLELDGKEMFDWSPMAFSPDGKSIAYSKRVLISGQWVSWSIDLYVLNISSMSPTHVDQGENPSWGLEPQ
jgi:Tol biopolymer transport system component